MSLYNFYRSKEFNNLRLNIIHERTTDFLYCEEGRYTYEDKKRNYNKNILSSFSDNQ